MVMSPSPFVPGSPTGHPESSASPALASALPLPAEPAVELASIELALPAPPVVLPLPPAAGVDEPLPARPAVPLLCDPAWDEPMTPDVSSAPHEQVKTTARARMDEYEFML